MYSKDQERKFFNLSKELLAKDGAFNQDPQLLHAQLVALINYHEWRYYVQANPILGDYEYDRLFQMLQRLEGKHPNLITPTSPTQRISSDLTSEFHLVKHLSTMLSLANSYNAEDLRSFDDSIKKALGFSASEAISYTVEPKFDGGSIALVYEDNILVRAATRGNGQEGDEMTANARTIKSIPLQADFRKYGVGRIELRGEAIIPKEFFVAMNDRRLKAGLPLFANPRNVATGGLRTKDPNETGKRGIEAFIYQIAYVEDLEKRPNNTLFASQWEGIECLHGLGFKVPFQESKRCASIVEVIEFCATWEAKRDDYPYEIDGMVVKVDSLGDQRKIGSTSHHPRWAIAYKFKAKQATTKLLNVEYQVGKIGSITPVAKLEPVQLAGVTVSSVSLHNEDFIKTKDLRLGDVVVVERAGDVIPYIVKPVADLLTGAETPILFPKYCPINVDEEIALVRAGDEAAWRCPSCTCGAQDLQRIIFHVSKPAMNIDGFGKSIVERFFALGWIQNLADVYALDFDKIEQLEGFGKKSADKLKSSIEKAKKNPIYRLLHSLSIHHLGIRASKILAAQIQHVLDLANWPLERYTEIKDIGPVLAENMVNYFKDPTNVQLLKNLEAHGVNLAQTEADRPIQIADNAVFTGKTMLFTGTLTEMGRKEAQKKAELHGAKIISAVSANLDILVVGAKAGSKLKKAQNLGSVEIITEEDFLNRIS